MSGKNKNLKTRKNNGISKNSKGGTIDETEEPQKDMTFEKAKSAIKNSVSWMTLMQSKPGGLMNYFKTGNFDRNQSENLKTYAFQANKQKNRNPEVPLYDHTRIRLKIEKETDNNYINASIVSCPPCDRKWTVAQHPMEAHYEDFWKMVFYEEIDMIFAIFSPDDGLPTYFPTETGKFFTHGAFWVHCWKMAPAAGRNQANSYTIEVLPNGCSNARYTTILHYPYWPKGQVAPSAKVILKGIQSLQPAEKVTKSKCLVHSTEGINRAMSVVLVDYIVELMFRNNTVDVPDLITMLRSQRSGAFSNRLYCIYALFVAIDYVKIRLTKFNSAPDILADINGLQATMKKEFATFTAKEPTMKSRSAKGQTVDVTIE